MRFEACVRMFWKKIMFFSRINGKFQFNDKWSYFGTFLLEVPKQTLLGGLVPCNICFWLDLLFYRQAKVL